MLEKYDPQYQQWKEEAKKKERAVEVFAEVLKEQLDQTMNALSPSLITPPRISSSPPGVPSFLVAEKRTGQNGLLETQQLRRIDAELLHKASCGRRGVIKDEFIQNLGKQFGDRRFVAALGEFITRHCG